MSVITSVWDTSSGAGVDDDVVELAGTIPFWSYLKPPASPHARNDHFDNASLGVQWTAFNPGSNGTVAETAAERLKISAPSGGDLVTGIVCAAPADDEYNVTLGFRPRGNASNFLQVGLICGGSDMLSAPTTANFWFALCLLKSAEWFWEFDKYNAYNAYNATDGTLNDGPFALVRYHVKCSANRLGVLVSSDGREWVQIVDSLLDSAGLTGTNPAFFGPGLNNIGNVDVASAVFDLFQVEVTSDRFSPVGGWVNLGYV